MQLPTIWLIIICTRITEILLSVSRVLVVAIIGSSLSVQFAQSEESHPCQHQDGSWMRSKTTESARLSTFARPIILEDPENDARVRIKSGDFRLLIVADRYWGATPDELQDTVIYCTYGTRKIAGTSGQPENERHATLIDQFKTYASRYNRVVFDHYAEHMNQK